MPHRGQEHGRNLRIFVERQMLLDLTCMCTFQGWEEGEMKSYWSKGTKFQLYKMNKFYKPNVQQYDNS